MLMKTPSERSYSVTGTISTSCRWWLSVVAVSLGKTAARLAQAALIRKVALIGSPATFSVGIDIVVSLLDRFCADCQAPGGRHAKWFSRGIFLTFSNDEGRAWVAPRSQAGKAGPEM